ncbi:MAG: LysM peptidoglycan-binding domain-containing protein [Spirochaetaceae bacterium]|nr:LysM peptidoglycan-binding domain-containing protein [Spirochaetaceae bacterium]
MSAESALLASDDEYELHDYDTSDYDDTEAPDLFSDQPATTSGGFSDFDFLDPNAGKAKIPLVPIICIICAIISLLSCIFIWLFSSKNKQPLQPLVVEKAPAVRYQSVTVVTEKPEPVDAALIDRISSSASAKEDTIVIIDAPVVIPAPAAKSVSAKDTKDYQIKWGDTLWDIADTFYKNPWMYDKIAKANNIKNPDFILSGTWIKIPPQ